MKNQNLLLSVNVLIFLFLFAGIHFASAQDELGLKGGILFSDIVVPDNNSNVEIEKRDGILVGVFYTKNNLLGKIGLQTELLYQQKGANFYIKKIESTPGSSYDIYTFELNAPKSYYKEEEVLHYISVPILINIPATKFLELYIGPEVGYLFSEKTNREITGKLNRFSAGATAGAILNFCKHTSIDLRYSRDLSSFDDLDKTMSLDMHNQGFSITLQQKLFIKQK